MGAFVVIRRQAVLAHVVRTRGLEPPSPCGHQPLKLTRIPIPPRPPHIGEKEGLRSLLFDHLFAQWAGTLLANMVEF